jgi:3-dehydrosphinganine reductase
MNISYYKGKLAFITGGSEGIGFSIAEGLLKAGGNVLIASRDIQKLQTAKGRLTPLKQNQSQIVETLQLDVTSRTSVEQQLTQTCERHGCPDFLINNAGYTLPGYLENLSSDNIHAVMETNFFGIVNTTKALLPRFYKERRGHIVNVSSVAGLLGVFGYTAYCATKCAVIGFFEALRREAAPYGVRVSVLCPPNTRTPGLIMENKIKPVEVLKAEETVKVVDPGEVAQALLKRLPKNPFIIIPTLDSRLVWRVEQLFPWLVDKILTRPLPLP